MMFFLSAAVMCAVYYFLPFVFVWLNLLIVFIAGFIFSFFWSAYLAGFRAPSSGFLIHIMIYLAVIDAVIYLFYVSKKK